MISSSVSSGLVQINAIQSLLFFLLRTQTILAGTFWSLPTMTFTEREIPAAAPALPTDTKDLVDGKLPAIIFIADTGAFPDHGNRVQSKCFYSDKLCRGWKPAVKQHIVCFMASFCAVRSSSTITSVPFIRASALRRPARDRPSWRSWGQSGYPVSRLQGDCCWLEEMCYRPSSRRS